MTFPHSNSLRRQYGLTLIELMVALAIGSFLIIGTLQIYNQSRQSFAINESIARVQETAQFAMDTIETDLRMASNWGRNSRPKDVDGRSIPGAADDPRNLNPPAGCGARWVLDLGRAVDGSDNTYGLTCAPSTAAGAAQANSDVITVRRASVAAVAPTAGRFQIQSTRLNGQLFKDGTIPPSFVEPAVPANPATPLDPSATHNLIVNSYYVAQESELIPGVPTLRRKTLTTAGGAPVIDDQEVAPGVENIQIQFGVDIDEDNTVDRYVNPGNPIYDPADTTGAYIPGIRIITARLWLVVRGITQEQGVQDNASYQPGNAPSVTPNDNFRRMMVSKTILLRNTRT
jgi:type IV pilus assembly protein PilW